jgi:hypothetical protein
MKRLITAAILAVSVMPLSAIGAGAANTLPTNAQRALQWLECTQQQANGQIGSGGNPIARSSEVAIGLAAAGQPASAMRAGQVSLADYLKTAVSTDVGTNGELLLARIAQPNAGATATVVTQLNLSKSNGEYGSDLYSDGLAILGLRAAGQPVGDDSVRFLLDHQAADGAWSFDGSDKFTDSNTTAVVILALISAGVSSSTSALTRAFDYLGATFNQGGFADAPGLPPDGNSDELVIQAILSAGLEDGTWQARLTQALQHLGSQQVAQGTDAGAINGFSKLFGTTLAPSAFLLRPLTATGLAARTVRLSACPLAAATAPAPTAHPTAAPPAQQPAQLARTGDPASKSALLPGVAVLILGLGILRRRARRAPRP